MNESIFKEWYFQLFVLQVEKCLKKKNRPRKAVLALEKSMIHPDAPYLKDKEINAIFLPPNINSVIHPMEQGFFAALKKRYRCKLFHL